MINAELGLPNNTSNPHPHVCFPKIFKILYYGIRIIQIQQLEKADWWLGVDCIMLKVNQIHFTCYQVKK
jgi:hypothetical protein